MREINEVTDYIRTHGRIPRKLKIFLTKALSKLYVSEEITTTIFGYRKISSPYEYSIYFFTNRNRLIVTTETCLNEDKLFFKPYSHTTQSFDLDTVKLSDISYGKFSKFLSDSYAEITLRGNYNTLNQFEIPIRVEEYEGDKVFDIIKNHLLQYCN